MPTRGRILVADEEARNHQALCALLKRDGYQVEVASDGLRARQALEAGQVDLLIASLLVPESDGFELLRAAKRVRPGVPVILFSGYGTIETAVQALKQGAYHYFQEPLDMDLVRQVVCEALQGRERAPAAAEPDPPAQRDTADAAKLGIIGQGPWLGRVLELLGRVAPTRATVLLTGESGTGKELFARAVHRMSGRKGPFVAVSCAALSRELLESELFGHEKGSFTGADRRKPGRFELANGGTLLLDEIIDIPLDLQVKLLRVLQQHEFERVGGTDTLQVDVRIVAACNRDIAEAVRQRVFREDLYYRLKVVEITLPPLRERQEDIAPLAHHFAQAYARANGRKPLGVPERVIRLLERHPWPGNVRELENAIERAVVLSHPEATELDPSLLPESIYGRQAPVAAKVTGGLHSGAGRRRQSSVLQDMDEAARAACLREALERFSGNAAAVARRLGVSPRMVRYYADKYGLPRRGYGGRAC